MSLLALSAILGWALILTRRLPDRPGAAVFLAVSSVISVIYVFACIDQLWVGSALLFYGGVAALLVSLGFDRSRAIHFLVSVPSVVFVSFAVGYWLTFSEAHYAYWDEFSQWGLATREILATNELYDLASNVRRPTAPPGAALWHYFVCRNTATTEGATYFAHFVLSSSALLPLYDGLSFRRAGWVLLTAALELLVLLNLGNGITILYVDQLISCFFAGILLVHLADPGSRPALLLLAAPLFALTLIKEPAVFFAGSAALFVAFHHLVTKAGGLGAGIRLLRSDHRAAAALCFVLVTPLLAVGSWQVRLASLESDHPPRSVWGTGARVIGDTDYETGFEDLVVERFVEVFLGQPMSRSKESEELNAFRYPGPMNAKEGLRFSTLGWLLCFGAASCAAWACAQGRDQKRKIALMTATLLVVFAAYATSLLRVYVTDGEYGTRLSSYVRYVNTALFPMLLISLAWFLPATTLRHFEPRSRWCAPVLLAFLSTLYAIETPNFKPLHTVRPMHPFRVWTQPMSDRIAKEVGAGHSLFVYVLPKYEASRLIRMALVYQLTPVRATVRATIPDDQVLLEALEHDYIWIFSRTPELVDRFRSAFGSEPPQPGVVYRIDRRSGALELIPILARSTADGPTRLHAPLLLRREAGGGERG